MRLLIRLIQKPEGTITDILIIRDTDIDTANTVSITNHIRVILHMAICLKRVKRNNGSMISKNVKHVCFA